MQKRGVNYNEFLDDDEQPIEEDLVVWRDQKQFLDLFAESIIIYDPLDRDILGGGDENLAIKRDNLKQYIENI